MASAHTARLAAAVILAAGLGGCGANPPPDDTGARQPQVVFEHLNAALLSVSGTPAGEVYAVGADPGDGLGPYILHYDGTVWQRLESPASGTLWWISVEMIDGAFYMCGEGGQVLRYAPDTGTFELTRLAGAPTIFGVWGTHADDLWAVGGDLDDVETGGVIWHFDGNDWTPHGVDDDTADLATLYKVWGRAADDVYVVGSAGTALHYDGYGWTRVDSHTAQPLFTVHGDATRIIASGGIGQATLVEWADGGWVDRAATELLQMNGVFVAADGTSVAVGRASSIAQLTPDGWRLYPEQIDSPFDLHAVWIDRAGGIWAVGGNLSAALNDGLIAYIGAADVATEVVWE